MKISLSATVLLLLLSRLAWPFPPYEQVKSAYERSDAYLLDRRGEIIHEKRVRKAGRRLNWSPLNVISPAMRHATVFAEDRRFYSHSGVDWMAVSGSLLRGIGSGKPRGASSITMQVVSFLDSQLRASGTRRSMAQKISQARQALTLEKSWTKDQILEAYLNLASFRGEIEGIDAASQWHFGKAPQGLNSVESVVLACLLRAPGASSAMVADRAGRLAEEMSLSLSDAEIQESVQKALSGKHFIKPASDDAPFVAKTLLSEISEPKVQSTLDGEIQRFAAETLSEQILSIHSQNVQDGAVLVVCNRTGEVLAYVGNTGESSSAKYVDGVRSLRQAGSTLKPFLYGLAIDRRLLTASSLLEDSPLEIPVQGGLYRPRNYDQQFAGIVTAREALASSLNVPAVKVLQMVGVDLFLNELQALGFDSLNESSNFYGPSLALGSADITLWNLVNAYRTLANGGVRSGMRMSNDISSVPSRRVLSRQTAFILSSILSDRESRSHTFGLENPIATRFWTAVKTGTSKDMRDNWCVGYSSEYTVGVWVGNFSGESMWNVSGVTGAAPVWMEVMKRLHRNRPSREPEPPGEIVSRIIKIVPLDTKIREFYLPGTEPVGDEVKSAPRQYRILRPLSGTLYATDPDIPEELQKITLEAGLKSDTVKWRMDGEIVGTAGQNVFVGLKPGNHELALLTGTGELLDTSQFEVRGAWVKADPGEDILLGEAERE